MAADDGERSISLRLRGVIQAERRRLQKARAVLSCAQVAMTYEDDEAPYADVVSVACELIDEAVEQLDSVNLKRPQESVEDEIED